MKTEVSLWDLPEERTYVKLEKNFRKNVFDKLIKSFGGVIKLTKFLGLKNHSSIRDYRDGYTFIPLSIIKKMLSLFHESKRTNIKKWMEENIEELKTPCGKQIKNSLPIKFSSVLGKIAGHLVGDGGIRIGNKMYTVRYANNSFSLIRKFIKDVRKIFPKVHYNLYLSKSQGKIPTWIVEFPSIVGIILTNLFGPLEGDAKRVPEIILNSDKESKLSFIRTLFDDEATSPKSHCIRIEMANKDVIETVRNMLFEFGIRPGRIKEIDDPNSKKLKYNFHISGFYDLKTFNNQIGFDHPEKRKKLTVMLKGYRHIQYKPGEIKSLIINALNDNGKMSLYELAKNLDRKPTAKFRKKVLVLEKEGVIKSEVIEGRLKIYSINSESS